MIGFTSADLLGLLPALLLVLAGMAVLLLEVFQRASFPRTHLAYVTALAALLAAAVAYLIAPAEPQTLWGGMVRFDALGCVITAFTAVACAITALGSTRYLEELEIDRGEYYALLLFATAGMSVMVSANDFVVLFLGLEMGAVAMYALTAYQRRSNLSSEAGFKYFLLGALGMTLVEHARGAHLRLGGLVAHHHGLHALLHALRGRRGVARELVPHREGSALAR